MAVVLAVWYLVGMAFAKRVKWSVITNIFSYPPLDFSNVKKSKQTRSNGCKVCIGIRV